MKRTGTQLKTCTQCGVVKPLIEFNFKRRADDIRHSYCRECGKKLTRSHYQRRKRLYLDRNLRSYAKRREIVVSAKLRPCADCGIQYPYYVMDFDHRETETKLFMLSGVPRATSKSLMVEIEKCDVVCSNCHRERTQRRLVAAQKHLSERR